MPDAIAPAHDPVPPPPIWPDPDLRPIDLASSDRLDDEARLHLARAGQDALDACLRRFSPEEREAFWFAICRCYNRPYNPPETSPPETSPPETSPPETSPPETPPPETPPPETPPLDVVLLPTSPDLLPAPHVIEAVRPLPDGALAEATLR